jgi:subtilase family protein
MADEPRRADVLIADCPIQPHVWREFRDRPKAGLELIAHLRPEASAVIVAGQLRDWLPQRGEKGRNSIFAFDAYVLVDVEFDDLVTALLPLTAWSDLLVAVSHLSAKQLTAELVAARRLGSEATSLRPRPVSEPSTHLSQEDYGRLRWLLAQVVAVRPNVTSSRMQKMLMTASDRASAGAGPLLSVGYNRWAEPAVSETRRTIKADAAEKVFDVDCSKITWAVVDTGIDASHPMFANRNAGDGDPPTRVVATYDIPAGVATFRRNAAGDLYASLASDTDWDEFRTAALVNDGATGRPDRFAVASNDHGTHVAGILAGGPQPRTDLDQANVRGDEPEKLQGVCPTLKLVDIRVFDENGRSREFEVVVGLAFLRWLNRKQDPRIDGVNISLSIPFAIDNFACGWTPVCVECERLVSDGVVVVTSAGNSGFDDSRGTMSIGAGFQLISIADPGNAETVITVGATHRTDPHKYGPISRSARGPTADGRHKPDLLAPGDDVWGPVPSDRWGKKTGTSQAAPHVSAVAAMLLARFPELRGRPYLVKEILLETATDLRRLVDFQGHGLVDALRALQRP